MNDMDMWVGAALALAVVLAWGLPALRRRRRRHADEQQQTLLLSTQWLSRFEGGQAHANEHATTLPMSDLPQTEPPTLPAHTALRLPPAGDVVVENDADHAALLAAYREGETAAQAAMAAAEQAAQEAAAQAEALAAAQAARQAREAAAAVQAERDRADMQARLNAAAQEMAQREAAALAQARDLALAQEAQAQQARLAAEAEAAEAQARAEAQAWAAAQAQALAQAAATAPAPAPAPPAPARQAADTLVMVVDDSKVVRVKTSRLLGKAGFQVALAADGGEALQQLQNGWPQVLITDVEMPGIDGFELTRQVRAQPAGAHLPIVMITGADDRLREAAQTAGVTVLMGKPYSEDALLAQVAALSGVALGVG